MIQMELTLPFNWGKLEHLVLRLRLGDPRFNQNIPQKNGVSIGSPSGSIFRSTREVGQCGGHRWGRSQLVAPNGEIRGRKIHDNFFPAINLPHGGISAIAMFWSHLRSSWGFFLGIWGVYKDVCLMISYPLWRKPDLAVHNGRYISLYDICTRHDESPKFVKNG